MHISSVNILYNCYSSYVGVYSYISSPCFTPICFRLFDLKPLTTTTFLNLRQFVFSRTLSGWFSFHVFKTFSLREYHLWLTPNFSATQFGLKTRSWCAYILLFMYLFICTCLCISAWTFAHVIWRQNGKHTHILFN